ncbi:MAG: hypothetical protein Q8934_18555, partial [Bacillota bacterium]|nr:hypothetical protein [Bacillota bacterium]
MSYQYNNNNGGYGEDLIKGLAKWGGRKIRNKVVGMATRLTKTFIKNALKKGIKLLLTKTAPIWGPVLFLLILVWLAFMLVYALPRSVFEDKSSDMDTKISAFFGFSDVDKKGYEDLFNTYKEVANGWDAGLADFQKQQ